MKFTWGLVQERGLQFVSSNELTNEMMVIEKLFFTPISYINCKWKLHSILTIKRKKLKTAK